jgi:DNA-binding GntR family transcriptional regulator
MSESKPTEDQSIVTRDVARDYILKFLISSEYLLPGDRMNLPFFAKRLNCSVTPIREAFAQLSHSGLIKVVPKRGFHIAAFGEKEARQLLHAIIGLESQSIRAAAAGQLNLRSLANANESIRNANTPAERFFAGVGFHQELASFFDGTHLSNLLFEMKVRLYFYMKTYPANCWNSSADYSVPRKWRPRGRNFGVASKVARCEVEFLKGAVLLRLDAGY